MPGVSSLNLLTSQKAAGNGSRGSGLAKDIPVGATKEDVANARKDQVERKTPEAVVDQSTSTSVNTTVYSTQKTNVLSKYRSYTYRFTLACITAEQLNDPDTYTKGTNNLNFVILKSGGKGANAIKTGSVSVDQVTAHNNLVNAYEVTPEEIAKSKKNIEQSNSSYKELAAGFNQTSAGRFDMFIENVQIDTVMTFTEDTSATLPTQISFDVIEPYSVNGFLEALGTAAVSAGWDNYMEASYILLIEWIGYPDNDKFTSPKILDEKRYLTIKFSGMEMDITEKGTQYKCSCVPYNDIAQGVTGRFSDTVSATGKTVGELISSLVTNYNQQLTDIRAKTHPNSGEAAKLHDQFDIKFDDIDDNGNFILDTNTEVGKYNLSSEIAKSDLYDTTDAQQYGMLDPQRQGAGQVNYPTAESKAKTYKIVSAGTDKTVKLTFNNDVNLRDAIAEIIVNSTFIRKMLKDLTENNGGESLLPGGMVKYFLVRTSTTSLPGRDELKNSPLTRYTFRVSPYKILRGRIPGFAKLTQPLKDLLYYSQRSYSYIYTGKNTEIISFKLQYNNLFFEGITAGSGINDSEKTKDKAAPSNGTVPAEKANDANLGKTNQEAGTKINPTPVTKTIPESKTQSIGAAVQAQPGNPYYALATNLHKALVDPASNMLVADIEIMGDPFYLVTGGIGNQVKTANKASTVDNTQASHQEGDVIIDIVFRNPDDIGADGFMKYNDLIRSPFHGAYRVMSASSSFKDGVFKQRLSLTKVSGQDPTNSVQFIDTDSGTTGTADPTMAVTQDARDKSKASVPDTGIPISAFKLGAVSPSSNYANISGGLGQGPLTQAFGAVTDGAGKLTAGANIYGNAILGGTPSPIINFYPSQVSSKIDSTIANIQGNANRLFPNYIPNPDLRLSGLTGGAVGNAQSYLQAVSNTVPTNINLSQLQSDGLSFRNLKNLNNIPPGQPKTVADNPESLLSIDEQQIVAKGGIQGLADARGVSPSELSASLKKEASDIFASNNSTGLLTKFINDTTLATNSSLSDRTTLDAAYQRYQSGNKSGTTFIK